VQAVTVRAPGMAEQLVQAVQLVRFAAAA